MQPFLAGSVKKGENEIAGYSPPLVNGASLESDTIIYKI